MSGRMVTLVGGGARSGKSTWALGLARALGPRRLFVATAEGRDAEMRERIRRHQDERGAEFATIEEPREVAKVLRAHPAHDVILVDCLTLWLANELLAGEEETAILGKVDELIAALGTGTGHVILVTNEVGLGIVPESALGRVFRDLAGAAHQRLSRRADVVYFAVLGMMLRLKPSLAVVQPGDVRP